MLSSPLTGALTSQTQGTHQRNPKASLALETRSENMLSSGHASSVAFQSSEVQFSLFPAFRLMISLAELRLTVKRMDQRHQPRSLIG